MPRRLFGAAEEADNRLKAGRQQHRHDKDAKLPGDEQGEKRKSRSPEKSNNSKNDAPEVKTVEGRTSKSASPSKTASLSPPPEKMPPLTRYWRNRRARSPWSLTIPVLLATVAAAGFLFAIVHAFLTRQLDPKGCDMCWSRPIYVKFADFDTEHTRFASKYGLYMIREGGIDEDPKVKGVPVLFIPGNAGSYKQARCLEFEAASYYQDVISQDPEALKNGATSLDFFTLDFNEDFSAFHGQTLLDQAEYVNDAVAYILSLYHDPRRAQRDPNLPDPSSVILIGHSMGGVVARAMLTMPNYQSNSINTIITMSAPHARAPVSVDSDLVNTYARINEYWRQAYLQKWANDNPLWHVTLVSIAGGGLDTVVPNDYASLESLVPKTHGFTVFTSGIPNVWTGADHIQTTWCVQLMKSVMRSVFETLNVHRPGQTKPRADRMRIFKRYFLTGLEGIVEKAMPQQEASTLVPLARNSNTMLRSDERLVLRQFGGHDETLKAYMFPIPGESQLASRRFSLLSDQLLQGDDAQLEVLFCSVYPSHPGQSKTLLAASLDLTGETPGSTRLTCRSAGPDVMALPASTRRSTYPFDKLPPFSFLQYKDSDMADMQFVAIIDKASEERHGWLIAEFSDLNDSTALSSVSLRGLLTFGMQMKLPAIRPLITEITIPSVFSSLLALRADIGPQTCREETELFTPLMRQYLEEPYESKFFVNVKSANISLHGLAPFVPPPLHPRSTPNGLAFQFWSDPTCDSSVEVSLQVDVAGSMGKLVMRYRLVFAAFPLLVVALVLRKQFQIYDETGVFITFVESLDLCLRSSLPLIIFALSILAMSPASTPSSGFGFLPFNTNSSSLSTNLTDNTLLLGSQDPYFWFLVPLFALISVGCCVLINIAALSVTQLLYIPYQFVLSRYLWTKPEESSSRPGSPIFSASPPRRRLITTFLLLFLVSTIVPYQFAFLDAVIVQLFTCIRALRQVRSSTSSNALNFYNYAHSILILMLWVLPINLPVLVVWIHNLAVHWLTPFSSHHNIISVMPYLILVETLTSGRVIPRLGGLWTRHVTSLLLFALAIYSAIYGVSYAYRLHHFANLVCAWLVAVHIWGGSNGANHYGNGGGAFFGMKGLRDMLEGSETGEDGKKQP